MTAAKVHNAAMIATPNTAAAFALSLEFERGRGYLCAVGERVSEWVTVERLKMEIPDLRFPLDVTAGVNQFRDRRCSVSELAAFVPAAPLERWLASAVGAEVVRVERGRIVCEWSDGARGSGFAVFGHADGGVVVLHPSEGLDAHAELGCAAAPWGTTSIRDGVIEVDALLLVLAAIFIPRGWKIPDAGGLQIETFRIDPAGITLTTAPAAERREGRPRLEIVEPAPMASLVAPELPDATTTTLEEFRRELADVQRASGSLDALEDESLSAIFRKPKPDPGPVGIPQNESENENQNQNENENQNQNENENENESENENANANENENENESENENERENENESESPEYDPAALSDARKSGDDGAIADALEAELRRPDLTDAERLELAYELGELAFYELEDNARALPHLQWVRETDPDGYGARTGLLNAIEAIYEEEGSVEGQLEILRSKLERAESRDMADTYRLLLAQLTWEELRDDRRATAWLGPIFERDATHEGALRLVADIAIELERWDEAADRLATALTVAGDGLDSVELERKLANILLRHLDRPDDAARHFEHVLKAAPGDAAAMAALRECQAALGDWQGYCDALVDELGMLLGRIGPHDDDWQLDLDPFGVPGVLASTAAHIYLEVAGVYEDHLRSPAAARDHLRKAVALAPERVDALERAIALDRVLEDDEALAEDLLTFADVLLDPADRFDALLEAAERHPDPEMTEAALQLATPLAAELGPDAEARLQRAR